jgi:flavodoxin
LKTLVAFYSSSGTTRKVGLAIAAALNADVEDIQEVNPRRIDIRSRMSPGQLWKVMRGGGEAGLGRVAGIVPSQYNPADYDLVVVGTPIWNSGLTPPARAYLVRHMGQFKSVAFFCTSSAPTPRQRWRDQMEKVCGRAPRASASFQMDQVDAGTVDVQVKEFVARLT